MLSHVSRRKIIIIISVTIVLVFLLLAGPFFVFNKGFARIKGFVLRFSLPRVTRAPWVEQLEDSGNPVADRFYLLQRHPNKNLLQMYLADKNVREELRNRLKNARKQKRKFYEAYKSGKGRYGLRKQTRTIEGDVIYRYIIVRDGQLTVVHDYTRDVWGPPGFKVYQAKKVEIGCYVDKKFTTDETLFTTDETPMETSPTIVLQFNLSDERRFYF